MARTRRQVTLQEQESGVPASPPQSLPTAPRATRAKRTTTRDNPTAAHADPPPSTRGGPAVRGGRIGKARKVGRGRIQPPAITNDDAPESSATDVDGPEASDSLPQTEVAVQNTPTTRKVFDHHDVTEDVEEVNGESAGETQSPTGVSTQPVQIEDVVAHPVQVQNMPAHPVQASNTPPERLESATSLKFRDILKSSPQSPGLSPRRFPPKAVSPITPMNPAFVPSSGAPSPSSISPLSSSAPIKPAPQAPSPASQTPVYYMPSNPEHSHSLITIRMDYFQGSKDPVRPSKPAAFAVPSELVAPFCRYIESRAKQGSDLSKLTTDHPAVNTIVHGTARYRPQLPAWQTQLSPKPPGSTMRDAFIRRAQRKRGFREMEEETATLKAENVKLKAVAAGESTESPPKRTKLVPDPWTADGQLVLGRTKEIEVDEYGMAVNPLDEPNVRWSKSIPDPIVIHFLGPNRLVDDTEARKKAQLAEAQRVANDVGESPYTAEETPDTNGPPLEGLLAEAQEQVEQEQVPETPRTRGWGLSKYLPSARSVTKYIPFSSRRTTSTQPPPPQPQQLAQTEPQITASSPQPQQLAQTGPQITASSPQPQHEPDVADTVTGPGHRRHQSTSNQQRLLTKQQWEEEKRIKRMRAQMRREAEALEKKKKDLDIAMKELAEQQKSADITQTPGQKRKRIASPDTIPLPASGGYGMVDEYFIVESSSDEEDVATQDTPTKERPLKKARTNTPNDATIGSPFKARPYTGTLFAHPDALGSRQDDNVFVESNKPNASPVLNTTPPAGPTLVFKVPSPGSSDSDSDDEDYEQEQINKPVQIAPSSSLSAPKGILRNSKPNQSQSRPTANSSPSKTLAPPPRPNPSHATLPVPTAMTPSGALEKAREKALRHQPKQPSTLRESSRLSTSTVNSDLGDEENVEEYDPAHPAIITTPSKAPVFGQPTPSAAHVPSQPIIGSAAPTESQHVTQATSEQPHGETSSEVSAHANDVRSSGQPLLLAEDQTKLFSDSQQITRGVSPKITADLDRWWKEHGDDYVFDEGYEEFQEHLLAEEQELMDGPNGDPYHQPRNLISAALDRIGANSLADRGIQTEIEENWRPGDLERTESDPANGMRVFFNRLVKNGAIEKDLADRVIAMGVPPGITKYLAGQEVTSLVAA